MILREQIVQEALSWLRTPYHPAARLKGIGTDCAQLLYCVYHTLGLLPEIAPECRTARWFLAHGDETYLKSFQEYAREITESELGPGDVILYKQPRFSVHHHGGIVVSWPDQIVHSVRHLGVTLGHATQEGFLKNCERKCFTFIKEE